MTARLISIFFTLFVCAGACAGVNVASEPSVDAGDVGGDVRAGDPDAPGAQDTVPPAGGRVQITFTTEDEAGKGTLWRVEAAAGARPENVSALLDPLATHPGEDEGPIRVSWNGRWYVFSSSRVDAEASEGGGWPALVLAAGTLSGVETLRCPDGLVRGGSAAVTDDGAAVVFTADTPAGEGLWVVRRSGDIWTAPALLTGASPYAYHSWPGLSPDGSTVAFDCGTAPYGEEGTAICEVALDGTGFRVVAAPDDTPPPGTTLGTNRLHAPAYEADGSLLFESDWDVDSERIWRLRPGGAAPDALVVAADQSNDVGPVGLPDGRIASLWADAPGVVTWGHYLKLMDGDGQNHVLLAGPDLTSPMPDILDIGLGAGWFDGAGPTAACAPACSPGERCIDGRCEPGEPPTELPAGAHAPFVPAAPTGAATRWVAPNGDDGNDGSRERPWRQVSHAALQAGPGDVIEILDGTYESPIIIGDKNGTAAAPIVFRAAGDGALIDGSGTSEASWDTRDAIYIYESSHVVIHGLRESGAHRAGLRVSLSDHVTVQGCVFGDNGTWGIFTDVSDDLRLLGNECFGSREEHGIYHSNGGDRAIIVGNYCHDNHSSGIQINADPSFTEEGADGISTACVIERNRLARNGRRLELPGARARVRHRPHARRRRVELGDRLGLRRSLDDAPAGGLRRVEPGRRR